MAPLLVSVRIPTLIAIFWRKHLARAPEPSNLPVPPRRIIVFRLDQLGDLVLTTPLFRELKRNFPNSTCTVVVQPSHIAILTTNPNIDEILPLRELETRWSPARVSRLFSVLWFYWTQLRHRHFDLAVSPRWDVDENVTTMLCALTNAARRIGHSEQVSPAKQRINRGFDAAFDVLIPPGSVQHEVDRNLQIVETLGGRIEDRSLHVCLTANDRKVASELLTPVGHNMLRVAIGIGGRAASRRWPLECYAELIARLGQAHYHVQPIIVCGPGEEADASALTGLLSPRPYVLGRAPLRAVCAVLERCDLFVGNDSGTAHLAAAMDCSTLVVSRHPLGGDPNHANSPARFAPCCSRFRVVQPPHGADDCQTYCHSTEPHCIELVTVEAVLDAALSLLHEAGCDLGPQELPGASVIQSQMTAPDHHSALAASAP